MKNIFYILIIILFLNSCLVEKTRTIKGVKSDHPIFPQDRPDQTYTTTGAGKVLANSIDSMTEGVPGVLNAAQLVLSIMKPSKSEKFCKEKYRNHKRENYENLVNECIQRHIDNNSLPGIKFSDIITLPIDLFNQIGKNKRERILKLKANQEIILKDQKEQEQIRLNRQKIAANNSKNNGIATKHKNEQQNIILINREQQKQLKLKLHNNKLESKQKEITKNYKDEQQNIILKNRKQQKQLKKDLMN